MVERYNPILNSVPCYGTKKVSEWCQAMSCVCLVGECCMCECCLSWMFQQVTYVQFLSCLSVCICQLFYSDTSWYFTGMFDRDHSGTINFQEFCGLWQYLQQWRATFDSFDTDRSGSIDQGELQTAFQRLGYSLSPNFTSLVLSRFDRQGHRALKLDDFIQCCVLLRMLTDTFRAKDAHQRGIIQLSYEDFMTMAILGKP